MTSFNQQYLRFEQAVLAPAGAVNQSTICAFYGGAVCLIQMLMEINSNPMLSDEHKAKVAAELFDHIHESAERVGNGLKPANPNRN